MGVSREEVKLSNVKRDYERSRETQCENNAAGAWRLNRLSTDYRIARHYLKVPGAAGDRLTC